MTTETIEVDSTTTAAALKALAAAPVVLSGDELADLDRQWAAVKAGEPTVSHEDVAQWLRTWGTPAFKPRRER